PGMLLRALCESRTWRLAGLRRVIAINGFIFVRTIFLMTALAMIMRVAGRLGTIEMAASHVINQYMMLIALGLDGFAHAAEALAGKAWGERNRERFRHWVFHSGAWSGAAALLYSALFWLAGPTITDMLTDIESVRTASHTLMPLVIALPVVAVWCYHFDGVFIGATAAGAMMVTMGIAFVGYLLLLDPMSQVWGLHGLWGAVLVFMALRGLAQAAWYPRLEARLDRPVSAAELQGS
ncbi:MAG: MATE family efflux transporter, partial [Xanthomonadales bacterium]|nr:MATE family efflux transporter [Xanthomonadales bacterium]